MGEDSAVVQHLRAGQDRLARVGEAVEAFRRLAPEDYGYFLATVEAELGDRGPELRDPPALLLAAAPPLKVEPGTLREAVLGLLADDLIEVDAIEEADGLRLLCPQCHDDPPVGPVGTHGVICWSPTISQDHAPRPGRWDLVGTSIDDLTLVAGSSSVLLQGGCGAHFFVRQGRVMPC